MYMPRRHVMAIPPPTKGQAEGPGEQSQVTAGRSVTAQCARRRWDHLSTEERRSWSAAIAGSEANQQGKPLVAAAEQHSRVATILQGAALRSEHTQGAA